MPTGCSSFLQGPQEVCHLPPEQSLLKAQPPVPSARPSEGLISRPNRALAALHLSLSDTISACGLSRCQKSWTVAASPWTLHFLTSWAQARGAVFGNSIRLKQPTATESSPQPRALLRVPSSCPGSGDLFSGPQGRMFNSSLSSSPRQRF